MNKTKIKQIILEEIKDALKGLEENLSPEELAADSRPEDDDVWDKMDGEMYDDAGDPMEESEDYLGNFEYQIFGSEYDFKTSQEMGSDPHKIYYDAYLDAGPKGEMIALAKQYAAKSPNEKFIVVHEDDWFDEVWSSDWHGSPHPDSVNEMARTSNIFKLSQEASLKDILQFMQRVNDVLKTYKSPGQKRPKKRFSPEEMKALATAMLNPEGFTSKDIIASTSYTSPAQANKFLAALEQKGLITITSILKKSLVPDRDPDAPETRGRKSKSAEFDLDDDPTGMDFGDFEDLDLSDPTALYEGEEDTITGEYEGKPVKFKIKDIEGIDDILNVSKGAKDFVNKLTMAVTDETSHLSSEDNKKVILFYKNKSLKEMKVTNKDGKDVTKHMLDYMEKKITKKEFEELAGVSKETKELKENNNNMSNNLTKHIRQQILEAKNPLAAKLKEIEAQGRIAALESKLTAIQEMIEETNGRLTRIDEDNEFSEMMDKGAVKEVRKQLKELERTHAKLQKEYGKACGKSKGGAKKETVVDEEAPIVNDEVAEETLDSAIDEVEIEEDNLRFEGLKGVHDLKPMVTMNESLLRMQKLAGLITESDIKKKP